MPRVNQPVTLMQAHEMLTAARPARTAPPQEWLAYHRRSSTVYAEIAEIDRGHHHEALYWSARERRHAEKIERRLAGAANP